MKQRSLASAVGSNEAASFSPLKVKGNVTKQLLFPQQLAHPLKRQHPTRSPAIIDPLMGLISNRVPTITRNEVKSQSWKLIPKPLEKCYTGTQNVGNQI